MFTPLRLRKASKWRRGLNRTKSPNETRRWALTCRAHYGITRLADITGLDRIGIPVYSAVVPDSDDYLSVYNGKGARREDAMAGALMEAIERQVALRCRLPYVSATLAEIRRIGAALDPDSVTHALAPDYDREQPVDWVAGHDLLHGEAIYVPAMLAGYLWKHLPHRSPFALTTSHGLASGNCLEEAIVQALYECIERDAWTLAELRSHWLPLGRRVVSTGAAQAGPGPDDFEAYPCLDMKGGSQNARKLLRRFHSAGIEPIVRDITSDIGVPTVLAASAEDEVPKFPQCHLGLGTDLDVGLAAGRALSELAQSRAVDIQGVREDICLADGPRVEIATHTRRVERIDRESWLHTASRAKRHWSEVPSVWNDDLLEDIHLILARLQACGIRQVIVVDLSPPDRSVAVVRVIVPGLEYWASEQGRIGMRALTFWKRHAV